MRPEQCMLLRVECSLGIEAFRASKNSKLLLANSLQAWCLLYFWHTPVFFPNPCSDPFFWHYLWLFTKKSVAHIGQQHQECWKHISKSTFSPSPGNNSQLFWSLSSVSLHTLTDHFIWNFLHLFTYFSLNFPARNSVTHSRYNELVVSVSHSTANSIQHQQLAGGVCAFKSKSEAGREDDSIQAVTPCLVFLLSPIFKEPLSKLSHYPQKFSLFRQNFPIQWGSFLQRVSTATCSLLLESSSGSCSFKKLLYKFVRVQKYLSKNKKSQSSVQSLLELMLTLLIFHRRLLWKF